MSQALPMTRDRRIDAWFPNGQPKSARQRRQDLRMADRRSLIDQGDVEHGATGERIRRPLEFASLPPEHGSFRTHIAAYCAPCDLHGGHKTPWDPKARPRLHRYPVGAR